VAKATITKNHIDKLLNNPECLPKCLLNSLYQLSRIRLLSAADKILSGILVSRLMPTISMGIIRVEFYRNEWTDEVLHLSKVFEKE